ncbi:hypothetical protein VIBHAR_02248 [Vibrio campbellii ATCC BAA-1116]|uniref:Uncharacterized protein n=1 Tax=Vibrio campbellii (strain ATCC BAA-1116) TaxID=2902295 RepID=A7MVN6_VIBC1|nr:hypothetical protein VIBHAR_02248 [Vibrio campbellii ATCC BAA-1116]
MQIQILIWHESELTSDGSSVAREFEELYSGEMQMMISKEISASPDSAQWQSINWKAGESHV